MKKNNNRIIYLSYNGILSHLGRSQILPYLKSLTERGYEFFVVSFEEEMTEKVDTSFFHWYYFRRKGIFKNVTLIRNVVFGTTLAAYLMLTKRIRIIHARSYIPAFMAILLRTLIPKSKFLFDMRGFMLDEYLEGGILQPNSLWVKIGRFCEKLFLQTADGIITLTEKSIRVLKQSQWVGERGIPITVIPSCTVLDHPMTNQINPKDSMVGNTQTIGLIYSGSLGSWYDFPRMLSFFELFHHKYALSTLDILSPQADSVLGFVEKNHLRGAIQLAAVPFSQVRRYLAQADIGLLFYQRGFSRIGTSPIKFAEYLWAGLATIATPGIGDIDEIITKYQLGVILDSNDDEAIERALQLLTDPELKERCRWVVRKFYNVADGAKLYGAIYDKLRS